MRILRFCFRLAVCFGINRLIGIKNNTFKFNKFNEDNNYPEKNL